MPPFVLNPRPPAYQGSALGKVYLLEYFFNDLPMNQCTYGSKKFSLLLSFISIIIYVYLPFMVNFKFMIKTKGTKNNVCK
jgi:hypothetical protein